jgi:hypothetical protein
VEYDEKDDGLGEDPDPQTQGDTAQPKQESAALQKRFNMLAKQWQIAKN